METYKDTSVLKSLNYNRSILRERHSQITCSNLVSLQWYHRDRYQSNDQVLHSFSRPDQGGYNNLQDGGWMSEGQCQLIGNYVRVYCVAVKFSRTCISAIPEEYLVIAEFSSRKSACLFIVYYFRNSNLVVDNFTRTRTEVVICKSWARPNSGRSSINTAKSLERKCDLNGVERFFPLGFKSRSFIRSHP